MNRYITVRLEAQARQRLQDVVDQLRRTKNGSIRRHTLMLGAIDFMMKGFDRLGPDFYDRMLTGHGWADVIPSPGSPAAPSPQHPTPGAARGNTQ